MLLFLSNPRADHNNSLCTVDNIDVYIDSIDLDSFAVDEPYVNNGRGPPDGPSIQ